ncbi:hypothetical protein SOASR030_01880 [Leminorella grimontii]|uniref:Uncharacterized protein n=1 Tax=Leminorella grimontii TaxID=82981 RepID=A0AAV5MZY4_9GAMM|nr:hypothetical protein SOASR030_01880 [Leminorella grimontii]
MRLQEDAPGVQERENGSRPLSLSIDEEGGPMKRLEEQERLHKHIIRDAVLFPLAKQCEKARKALEEAKKSVKEHRHG